MRLHEEVARRTWAALLSREAMTHRAIALSHAVGCSFLAMLVGSARAASPAGGGGSSSTAELTVHRGAFARSVLLTGELAAVRAVQITVPRTSEWQVQIRWMEADGAEVAAGEKILELDNTPFAAALEQNRLAAHKARTELLQQRAAGEATLAEKELAVERARIAVEKVRIEADVPSDLLSRRDWEEKQLALERARVEDEKARDDLAAAGRGCEADLTVRRLAAEKADRELSAAEEAIALLTVTAPRGGIALVNDHPWEGRKLQVGDTVWVGYPVMRIPDLGEMRVDASLADVDDGAVSVGDPAICTLDAYPDRTFPGTVTEIAPVAQETSRNALRRAFRVTVALARTEPAVMRPGMSVKVEVQTERCDDALLAPRAGLDLSREPPRARLAGGGTHEVRLGACSAQECVVVSGLAAGDRLAPPGGGQ